MLFFAVGFVESIVAVKIYASKHNYSISPNRELVAMGAANFIGSFFHTYPAFGSLTRSAVGDFLGARSQLFSFISAAIVLVTILALGPIVYYLPRVTMSAIIMIAAYSLIELHDLLFLWKLKAWKEISLLVSTFLITFTLGVDLGIFIGIGISLMLVIAHTSVPHITILGKDSSGSWVDASRDSRADIDPVPYGFLLFSYILLISLLYEDNDGGSRGRRAVLREH
jgi:MFS superfamily sulfate permease-like transporter